MTRRITDLAALVAATIMSEPCTVKAVCLAIGTTDRHSDQAMRYIRAFRAQGLVYVSSYSTRRRPVYAWQPSPWLLPDSPKPDSKDKRYSERRSVIERAAPTINTVFALGAAA